MWLRRGRDNKERRMGSESHVVVISYPVQGHMNPLVQFAKRLASKGVKVTLLTTTGISSSSSSTTTTNTNTNTNTNIQIQSPSPSNNNNNSLLLNYPNIETESISDGSEELGGKPETLHDALKRFQAVVPESLAKFLTKKLQNKDCPPPKVVVYDSVLPWALDVAHRLGLRGASFFTQNCAVSAIYYHIHQGHLKHPLEPPPPPPPGSYSLSLPALPPLQFNDLPSFISDIHSYPAIRDLVINQFSNFDEADWILFNTFDKLDQEIVQWMASKRPIETVGPCIPSMFVDMRLEDDKEYGLSLFKPTAEACINWLDTKDKCSVVYTSFGSLASLNETQMEELAWGIKNSNSYFLWVVRASEESKLPRDFMDETSEKGLVVNWCQQLQVLAHPAVGCFLTHCGWNSTLEALSLGVPMVAMPQWSDQTTNAKLIADEWKAGIRVKADEEGIISRTEIELSIREVMEGERGNELRRNAIRWKELAKEAVSEGGSSDTNINKFVSELQCIN